MNYYVFDLDGTLANIDHRLHFLERNDWDGFFQACDQDTPVASVIEVLLNLYDAGHNIEIWSGRSAVVEQKTLNWLDEHISYGIAGGPHGGDFLTHMRKEGDYRPDTVLKEEWLFAFHQKHGFMPTMIFDDRPSVVEMWRRNGVTCAQVASWDDRKRNIQPHSRFQHMLTLLVGPSGAGKSSLAQKMFDQSHIISSDQIRKDLCMNFQDQSRNNEVFQALHALVETRLKSGLPTVVDATNLRAKDRKTLVEIANKVDGTFKVRYVVIDRPLSEKIETGGWRNEVVINGQTLIEKHHMVFNQNLKDILRGDGFENVDVYPLIDTAQKARIYG